MRSGSGSHAGGAIGPPARPCPRRGTGTATCPETASRCRTGPRPHRSGTTEHLADRAVAVLHERLLIHDRPTRPHLQDRDKQDHDRSPGVKHHLRTSGQASPESLHRHRRCRGRCEAWGDQRSAGRAARSQAASPLAGAGERGAATGRGLSVAVPAAGSCLGRMHYPLVRGLAAAGAHIRVPVAVACRVLKLHRQHYHA